MSVAAMIEMFERSRQTTDQPLVTNEYDFIIRWADDMDPTLFDFLKTKLNSLIKWDLVKFFHKNPQASDTIENLAHYAGRKMDVVQSEVEGLVESGVMQKKWLDDRPVYSLTTDETIQALVDQFIVACEDRYFRIQAIYHNHSRDALNLAEY